MRCEQLRQVHALDAGQVVGLRAAREAVRQVDVPGGRVAQRRQQRVLRDGDRHVVVALLHAEVAGQPAAARERRELRTGVGEQSTVGGPRHHGVVVAVRLHDRGHVGEVRDLPAVAGADGGGRGEQLRERARLPGDRDRARVVGQQVAQVGAQDRGARRLEPDDRDAVDRERPEHAEQVGELLPGAVELAGADPGEAAAGVVLRDQHLVAGVGEHRDGRLRDGRREGVGERVGPEHDLRLAAAAASVPLPGRPRNWSPGRAPLGRRGVRRRRPPSRRVVGAGEGDAVAALAADPRAERSPRERHHLRGGCPCRRRRAPRVATGRTPSTALVSAARPGTPVISRAQRGSQPRA